MNITGKRIFAGLLGFLLIGSMQISFQSCGDDSDEIADCSIETNTPTNDYYVTARVQKFGIFGCTDVGIKLGPEPIDAARVTINSHEMKAGGFGTFTDEYNSLAYKRGREYNLEIHVGDFLIASGTVQMPSPPELTGQQDTLDHQSNTPYYITWRSPEGASSVQISMESPSYANDFESPFLSLNQTAYSIPGHMFSHNGEYDINVVAICGVPPDSSVSVPDSAKGYSITGASGYFAALNVSGQVVLIVADGIDGPFARIGSEEENPERRLSQYSRMRRQLRLYR